MSNIDRVNRLTRQIEDARQEYVRTLTSLTAAIPPGNNPMKLIESAEEFGPEHSMMLFAENSKQFGIEPCSKTAERVIGVTLAAHLRATEALDLAFAERENILCEMDPKRTRRYCLDNRECEIDAKAGTLRFVDAPEKVYDILPAATLGPEPDLPRKKKRHTLRM